MRNSFGDSLKSLLADIEHANTLASEFQKKDGAYLQMMMSYSPAAKHFLCIAKWVDCSLAMALGLAGTLGLLRILICESRVDGRGTKSTCIKKASIKEFYSVIFPSLIQMQNGITVMEDRNRRTLSIERDRKIADNERRQFSELDVEIEEECGICMESNSKIVIPNCCHAMCFKCYSDCNFRCNYGCVDAAYYFLLASAWKAILDNELTGRCQREIVLSNGAYVFG